MRRILAVLLGFTILIAQAQAQQEQRAKTTSYEIPSDVVSSGGGDKAHSTNYLLDDTIGEANIGFGRSANFDLNAGYRQTLENYLAMTCGTPVIIGSITGNGQATGSGSCVVTTDNEAGYSLTWTIASGSGGTNTGNLISTASHDSINAFDASRAGLVGYWKLDETAGGLTAVDSSGNGNNGTPSGTSGANNLPQPSTDIPSSMNVADTRSLNFDGTDDKVDLGSNLPTLPAFTVSVWWNGTVAPAVSDNGWSGPVQDRLSGKAGFQFVNEVNSLTTFHPHLVIWNGASESAQYTTSTYTITRPFNAYHHFVWTYDGSTTPKFYVDGVAQTVTTSGITTYPPNGANIGDAYKTVAGDIDEVRMYNRPLSAAEVQALYNSPHAWSVAANAAAWGARLRSTSADFDNKWGTDGAGSKWLNIGDGTYPVVTRSTRTSTGGSAEIFQYRAEIGSNAIVPNYTYQATVTYTASAL